MRRSLHIATFLSAGTAAAFSSDIVITRSYTLHDNNGIIGNDSILHEVRPAPRDPTVEEDEVEMYYPTTRRAFMVPTDNDSENINKEKILHIRQTSFGCGRLGATVWPSAIALASLLASDPAFIEGKRCIELGSGCGLPSRVAKEVCNAHSILATDYWEVVDKGDARGDRLVPKDLFGVNLAYNIGSLGSTSATMGSDTAVSSVERLDWHDDMGIFKIANEFRPDVIIGSDLVYYPMDTQPLLQTLEMLLKAGGDGASRDALLILPLPPNAEREALPDFRTRLENGELGDGCEVQMDELEMIGKGRDDGDEDIHHFLRIQIHSGSR